MKKPGVHLREHHKYWQWDFTLQGIRCRESTGVPYTLPPGVKITEDNIFKLIPRELKPKLRLLRAELDLANLRNRIWYPTLKRAGLRPRDLYQTRHTFARLMLQAGEDPAWIARMMGHSNTRMLFERYAKWIKNRTRQDGSAYMQMLKGGN
jgi:integrase